MLAASILSNHRVEQKPNRVLFWIQKPTCSTLSLPSGTVSQKGPALVQPQLMLLFMLVIHPPICTDPCLFHGKEKRQKKHGRILHEIAVCTPSKWFESNGSPKCYPFFLIGHLHCQYQYWGWKGKNGNRGHDSRKYIKTARVVFMWFGVWKIFFYFIFNLHQWVKEGTIISEHWMASKNIK